MKCYGKINLNLKVINKREDGYHNLDSYMVKINLYDTLTIKKSKKMEIKTPIEDDIIFKIIKYFKEEYKINSNYKIILNKKIPICAGLGGASTDAAVLIKEINRIENLGLTINEMAKIGLLFGSDIPFFIYNENGVIKGKGDVFSPKVYLGEKNILIVNPNILISTKEIFDNYKNDKHQYNDLIPAIYRRYPKLEEIIKRLNKKFNKEFKITGSGSTFYLIDDVKNLRKIRKEIKKEFKLVKITKII